VSNKSVMVEAAGKPLGPWRLTPRAGGFKELDKVCGNPPSRCVFENAPGTGENRECGRRAGSSSLRREAPPLQSGRSLCLKRRGSTAT